MQGTVLRPLLSVTTFGASLTHSGLEVRVSAKQQQGDEWVHVMPGGSVQLAWDGSKGRYASPHLIDTYGM